MPVFKYAEGSEPKDKGVPEDSEKTKEVREERKEEGTKQPAPAEVGTNTYEEGENDGGRGKLDYSKSANVSGSSFNRS